MITKAALETNKQNILNALRAAGIEELVLDYSGGGDSGQMGEISVTAPAGIARLPQTKIRFNVIGWSYSLIESRSVYSIEEREMDLPSAIEGFFWHCLQTYHCGWENNSGGEGTFTISVPKGEFFLRHVEFIEHQEVTNHTF